MNRLRKSDMITAWQKIYRIQKFFRRMVMDDIKETTVTEEKKEIVEQYRSYYLQ